MSKIEIDDPELVDRKTVGKDGRIYLGTEYSGREFEIVLSEIETDEKAPETAEAADL